MTAGNFSYSARLDDFPLHSEMREVPVTINDIAENLRILAMEVRRIASWSAEPGKEEFKGIQLPIARGEWGELMYVLLRRHSRRTNN